MNRTALFFLGSLGSMTFLAGCAADAADPADDTEASDVATDALSATSLNGYFDYDRQASTSRWLEAIALHRDGTFEANVGNSVSNLSGHHFPASGTYTLAPKTGGSVLTLKYSFFGDATDVYDVEVRGTSSVRMKLRGPSDADWFTLNQKKAVTLTFGDDWSVSQSGPLVAGTPLVVRYAASRNRCAAPNGGTRATFLHATVDGNRVWWIVQGFGEKPAKGVLGSLGAVPDGHHLALWFENDGLTSDSARTCTSWDSKFGANYYFPIAQR